MVKFTSNKKSLRFWEAHGTSSENKKKNEELVAFCRCWSACPRGTPKPPPLKKVKNYGSCWRFSQQVRFEKGNQLDKKIAIFQPSFFRGELFFLGGDVFSKKYPQKKNFPGVKASKIQLLISLQFSSSFNLGDIPITPSFFLQKGMRDAFQTCFQPKVSQTLLSLTGTSNGRGWGVLTCRSFKTKMPHL